MGKTIMTRYTPAFMRQTEALTKWAVTILENSKLLVYSEVSYTVFSLRVLVPASASALEPHHRFDNKTGQSQGWGSSSGSGTWFSSAHSAN